MTDKAAKSSEPNGGARSVLKCVVGYNQPVGPNLTQQVFEGFDEHDPGREVEGRVHDPNPRYNTYGAVRFVKLIKYPNATGATLHECARCGTLFAVEQP